MSDRFEALIVGMGPAGMAAAATLCSLGAQVALVDDNADPGGQVYRQVARDFRISEPGFLGIKHHKGQQLINELRSVLNHCTHYNDAYVWGSFQGGSLSLLRHNEISLVGYRKLLLCEGAMERSLPFPGWTLPGIMTLGGLQKLVLHERTLPGRRFVLAGCSPLLLPVASSILKAGGEIAAICDALSFSGYLELLPEFLRQRELAREAFSYYFPVVRNMTPILRRCAVISASGHSKVERARVAELSPNGSPVPGSEKDFQTDILGVSNGFLPLGRLARLCGCEHVYDPVERCWRPKTDDRMCSSLPDIYIAGDSRGIGGRHMAAIDGRLAALHMAGELGRISAPELRREVQLLKKERSAIQRYASKVNRVFSFPQGLLDAMDKDTIVCRCEQVTLGDVLAGIESGYRNVNEIKRTRIGMGLCQGRTCESIVAQIMLRKGIPVEEIGYLNLRPPLSPIPIALFEDYAGAHGGPN
jgi:thioredoxin reductase